ncbi:tetratricopeptide repeat protein [Komagataeibacter rhaeticus]|nr:tetratricopeptide repeat protein [Komagataeibacter rhaeticus]
MAEGACGVGHAPRSLPAVIGMAGRGRMENHLWHGCRCHHVRGDRAGGTRLDGRTGHRGVPAGGSTQITVTPDAGQNAANAHLAHAAAVLELLLNQGYYWLGQHNLPKARETIQRALSIEPDNNEALFLLGRLQMAEGQTKLAAATLGRLIQNGNAPGLVADLRAQIHAGPIDPRGWRKPAPLRPRAR